MVYIWLNQVKEMSTNEVGVRVYPLLFHSYLPFITLIYDGLLSYTSYILGKALNIPKFGQSIAPWLISNGEMVDSLLTFISDHARRVRSM